MLVAPVREGGRTARIVALRSSEADHGRKLGPVDGIEPAKASGRSPSSNVCLRSSLGDAP